MKYALNLAEDGRVLSVTEEQFATAGAVLVDSFPDGDVYEYRYVNGEFVHDPLPVEEVEEKPTPEQRIAELEEALALLLSGVTE